MIAVMGQVNQALTGYGAISVYIPQECPGIRDFLQYPLEKCTLQEASLSKKNVHMIKFRLRLYEAAHSLSPVARIP